MRQTVNLGLNLMDAADPLSAKPLNENAEIIDAVIKGLQDAATGRFRMASGSYVGNGTRSVTLDTPGFRPQAILVSVRETVNGSAGSTQKTTIAVQGGWCLWVAKKQPPTNHHPTPTKQTKHNTTKTIRAEVAFSFGENKTTWSIPALPANYFDIALDDGPNVVNNRQGVTYDWVALGVAV